MVLMRCRNIKCKGIEERKKEQTVGLSVVMRKLTGNFLLFLIEKKISLN